jgi:TRAP-type C4-dicarboxylate transport system permease small subunit
LEKVIHVIFDVFFGWIIKVLGIVMIIDVLLQIAFRYLPTTGTTWTEELGRLLFMWFCMLSTALTYVKGQHLAIDFFYLKWSKTTRTICDFISLIAVLSFSGIVSVFGYKLLELVAKQHSPVMRLSFFWFYLAVPVGCSLIAIFTILSMIDRVFLGGKMAAKLPENQTAQVN